MAYGQTAGRFASWGGAALAPGYGEVGLRPNSCGKTMHERPVGVGDDGFSWPKALFHRSLGQRPRNGTRAGRLAEGHIHQYGRRLRAGATPRRIVHRIRRRNAPGMRGIRLEASSFASGASPRTAVCRRNSQTGPGEMGGSGSSPLDMRNDYAHATTFHPTATQANAYIEHLLDVVMNPPFSVGAALAAQTQPA
jgi:hypothetical protein